MRTVAGVVVSESLATVSIKPKIIIHNLPDAHCDPSLIKQVWINLISNAVKYSARKKQAIIEIGAKLTKEGTIYYVKDNGAGFDMKFSNKLFRPFHRLHSESDYEGTGIGLALSQKIISKHGGKIWVDAEVNKGAVFYFTL
jgi:light-regulated signal transduction histidine kinase (bacteriophytochrome)